MMPNIQPLQLLLATFADWVGRHQAQVIDNLVTGNRVIGEQQARSGPSPNLQKLSGAFSADQPYP
jgi:hypothetical protein